MNRALDLAIMVQAARRRALVSRLQPSDWLDSEGPWRNIESANHAIVRLIMKRELPGGTR